MINFTDFSFYQCFNDGCYDVFWESKTGAIVDHVFRVVMVLRQKVKTYTMTVVYVMCAEMVACVIFTVFWRKNKDKLN
uniref:Uncharacterized protein n=1 Tax=Anguilla anguilla TaxID=7936 RepID=A0A0E9WVY1_ANGAN